MARSLAFALEPSDVFLALLRLRAAMEAGRWPVSISAHFAAATDREFAALEPAVRAIGVCYSELEARRVAVIDRVPQSRFADVDGALHLAACCIEVALHLDHVRVAIERGDPAVQDNGRLLASTLRQILWYVVHSDLLVCSRMALNGTETSPDRVIEYVDTYLASAWPAGTPPQPPTPSAIDSEAEHGSLAAQPPERTALPFHEATAISTSYLRSGIAASINLLADTGTTDTYEHKRAEPTTPSGLLVPEMPPQHRAAPPAFPEHPPLNTEGTLSGGRRRALFGGGPPSPQAPTSHDQLSDDALFFLDAAGIHWPCDVESLRRARSALLVPAPRDAPNAYDARSWTDRIERGYAELCRLSWATEP